MANEPSLSEITSVKGDADLAYGTAGAGGSNVQFKFSEAIPLLMQAGRERAAADQYKAKLFQDNMENFYKNFNELSVDGVMEKDFPDIAQEYAKLTADLAANYDVVRNPNKDLDRWSALREREASLRGKIAQSKQDVAYRDQFNKQILTNPTLNTSANQQTLQDFTNGDLGARTYKTLSTPTAYDPTAVAKLAREAAKQKVSATEAARGGYLEKNERTRIMEDEYMRYWNAAHNGQDSLGRSGLEAATNTYNTAIPQDQRGVMPFDSWLQNIGRSLMGTDEVETTHEVAPDQTQLQKDRLAQDQRQHDDDMAFRWANMREQKRQFELNLEKQYGKTPPVEDLGRMKNEFVTNMETSGKGNPVFLDNMYADKTEITKKVTEGNAALNQPVTTREEKIPKETVIDSATEYAWFDKDGKRLSFTNEGNTTGAAPPPGAVEKRKTGMIGIYIRDNETGKVTEKKVSMEVFHNDANRMLGDKLAVQVDKGSRLHAKKTIGTEVFDRAKFMEHFKLNERGQTTNDPNFRATQDLTKPKVLNFGFTN